MYAGNVSGFIADQMLVWVKNEIKIEGLSDIEAAYKRGQESVVREFLNSQK